MTSTSKVCTKCSAPKPAAEFYSGHAACKECTKARVRANYASKREQYAAYERVRSRRPERKAQVINGQKRWRAQAPDKYRARTAVGNALRDGRITKTPCEVRGTTKVQAHHDDYAKPLEVRWLCFRCHREHGHGQTVTATDSGNEAA